MDDSRDPVADPSDAIVPADSAANDGGAALPGNDLVRLDSQAPGAEGAPGDSAVLSPSEADGAAISGWLTDDATGQTFYYEPDGERAVGERSIDGFWYYFDPVGDRAMATGFVRQPISTGSGSFKTVYYDKDGKRVTGLAEIDGRTYYFDPSTGAMTTGFAVLDTAQKAVDSGTFFFDLDSGQMLTGEQRLHGGQRCFDDDTGAMATGFMSDGGSTSGKTVYYDGFDGAMVTGERLIDGGWYYFDTYDGHMARGWTYLSAFPKWVYYGADGKMRYGEQWIDGDRYWLDPRDGSSNYAQVLRWRLNHATSSGGLSLFGGAHASSDSMTQLARAVGSFTGQGLSVGFVMMDLATGQGVSSNADQTFYSASTVKAPYVASLYENAFHDDASAAAAWYQTLSDACVWSDNDAYYALRNAFGSAPFAQWLGDNGVDPNKAATNYTWFTPRELGKLWVRMFDYFGTAGDAGHQMSGLFSHGYYSSIYYELGDQYTVRSKPGWYPYDPGYTATNDAGIVYAGDRPYLVAVMSDAPVRLDLTQALVRALENVHASMVG